MKGKGQPPEYTDAPKTLWLAANDPKQRSGLLPFGWLLVETHPGNAPIDDWPELAELCRGQQTQARHWAEKMTRQKNRTCGKMPGDGATASAGSQRTPTTAGARTRPLGPTKSRPAAPR